MYNGSVNEIFVRGAYEGRNAMTQKELLTTIESLPRDVQFAIANSVIDRLASDGSLPISEELKADFLRREEEFFANPNRGEPWAAVREELFGQ